MCGIFGIVNTKGVALNEAERSAWARLAAGLAALSTARGTDSAGVARVAADGEATVLKAAAPAWELIAHRDWAATVTPADGTFALVGHTRFATHGAVTEGNAHPFVFSDEGGRQTVGVHNGVVNNHAALRGADDKVYAVDSANLIAALAAEKMSGWQAVLRRAEGTLALALVRSAPGAATTLTLTRRGNPLWVAAVAECGGALVFASTRTILEGAVRAARMRASESKELAEGVFYRWAADGAQTSAEWCAPAADAKKAARRARRDAQKVHHHATITARGKDYTQCAACLDWYPCDELTEHRGALLCPGDYVAATSWKGRGKAKASTC